jgi:hypothetical protein
VTYLVSCEAKVGEIVNAHVIEASDHDLVAEPR